MNADHNATDAARPLTAADVPEEGAIRELLELAWIGFSDRDVCVSLNRDGFLTPRGKRWSMLAVAEVVDAWAHVDSSEVPGTLAFDCKHAPAVEETPDPTRDELLSFVEEVRRSRWQR